MSTAETHPAGLLILATGNIPRLALYTAGAYFLYSLVQDIVLAFFSPLSKFPGPKWRAYSVVPMVINMFRGTETATIVALHAMYGPVVRTAPRTLSFLGSAEMWRTLYGFAHSNGATLAHDKDWTFYTRDFSVTQNLVDADTATHTRQRKIVSHAFSDRALKEQEPLLKMWADKLRSKLREQATRDESVDVVKWLNWTTFDLMADLTFAEPLHMLDNSEYVPWVRTIFEQFKRLTWLRAFKALSTFNRVVTDWLLPKMPALRRMQLQHWSYTNERVNRRLAKMPERPDLWSRILEKSGLPRGEIDIAILDSEKKTGAGLSLLEHYSTAGLFMVAGTETTATSLSGAVYLLLKNPKYLRLLQHELRSTFRAGIKDMHLDSLAQIPLLDAVLKESLRMYTPVPVGLPRVVPSGGFVINGMYVPADTSVSVHHLATYSSESNFARPYEFRPERWLGSEAKSEIARQDVSGGGGDGGDAVVEDVFTNDNPDAFEPFSIGPRGCIGKNLAWHEMRLLLSTVLTHFDLELCAESRNWAEQQKIYIFRDKRDLRVRLKEVELTSF